ncbi:MAG: DUF4062 domain-containing protein [Bryobacteraceae bacterium]|jgi:hypothetical protein
MLSSTFTDLEQHRAALIKAIKGEGLTDVAMENDPAKPDVDVIDSSLGMVREASAYIGVISRRYGHTPSCPKRNPDGLSLTELEFREAQRLGRPIVLFIMGDRHLLREADIETDASRRDRLNAFREWAKQMKPDSPVHRVYAVFDSLEDFNSKAIHAAANLRRYLDKADSRSSKRKTATPTAEPAAADPIPAPPALYAEPPYIGSHKFVGRLAQLDVLSDWAVPSDSHPVLLFDAIGGTGKSMLSWEWVTRHATEVRGDWAGRFWYSFYEHGAIMADFCRRALAYMSRKPPHDFRRMNPHQLSERLLHYLLDRPWLLVLDGLERVLVAYHRYDAAQIPDEVADAPSDQIARRDPCAAIRPEDDDLLRALAAAAPSKLLITSRLVPRVLLNPASQPIPGVLRAFLPGLRPADAEALLRSCGVSGTAAAIRDYLKSHCDCHPLIIGVLAGLIKDYLPDKGNFDAWAADPAGGGRLNLANLDLVQKRNHILRAALDALPEKSRQLLSTLALVSAAVDYPALSAFNPHLPPEPEEVKEPADPEASLRWKQMSGAERGRTQQEYQAALQRRKEYERAIKTRRKSPAFFAAPQALARTVRDLERRGLLQYDAEAKRHDLHPVVRGIAAGGLQPEEKNRYGQRVVDHFSHQAHGPYEKGETLEDFRSGLHVVRTLLNMGRQQAAYDAFYGGFCRGLRRNVEAYAELLSLIRPLFAEGWGTLPDGLQERASANLAEVAGHCLYCIGANEQALRAMAAALPVRLRQKDWSDVCRSLMSIAIISGDELRFAIDERLRLLTLDLATLIDDKVVLIDARVCRFVQLARIGKWESAEETWRLLPPRDVNWPERSYNLGYVELAYASSSLWNGVLTEERLAVADRFVKAERDRRDLRYLLSLRGEWHLAKGQWSLAAESLQEAVRMAREVGLSNADAETQLALARLHLGQLPDARREAEQLARAKVPAHGTLAELWLGIGDPDEAEKHAVLAYKCAWGDGEPYVFRYELNKARALLENLGAAAPKLPHYDPAKDERFPWEDEVAAAIEGLRAKRS